jgi:hypothetical protein
MLRKCPGCESQATLAHVVFGMPGDELLEAAGRGEVVLGGCMPPMVAWPVLGCLVCNWQGSVIGPELVPLREAERRAVNLAREPSTGPKVRAAAAVVSASAALYVALVDGAGEAEYEDAEYWIRNKGAEFPIGTMYIDLDPNGAGARVTHLFVQTSPVRDVKVTAKGESFSADFSPIRVPRPQTFRAIQECVREAGSIYELRLPRHGILKVPGSRTSAVLALLGLCSA